MLINFIKSLCNCFTNSSKNTNSKKVVSSIIDDKNLDVTDILMLEKAKPFIPPINKGIVTNVYDGDTFTIVAKLPYTDSPLYKFKVRIAGIDCPEIRGKSQEEKDAAQAAKKEVMELILYKEVVLENVGLEKYGRLLANVLVKDENNPNNLINIGQHLLNKGLAKVYNGSTKEPFL
jgi:endonuclease YncB( thermonuclease family)